MGSQNCMIRIKQFQRLKNILMRMVHRWHCHKLKRNKRVKRQKKRKIDHLFDALDDEHCDVEEEEQGMNGKIEKSMMKKKKIHQSDKEEMDADHDDVVVDDDDLQGIGIDDIDQPQMSENPITFSVNNENKEHLQKKEKKIDDDDFDDDDVVVNETQNLESNQDEIELNGINEEEEDNVDLDDLENVDLDDIDLDDIELDEDDLDDDDDDDAEDIVLFDPEAYNESYSYRRH